MSGAMAAEEARSAEQPSMILTIVPKKDRFIRATDSRGRAIEGLWVRNGRYYMQFSVPGKTCRRVPLKDENNQHVRSVSEAIDAMYELRKKKRQGELPTTGRAPKFDEYVEHYLSKIEHLKKPKTVAQEKSVLRQWKKFLGGIRLTGITKQHIIEYRQKRKLEGVGNRTVNYDALALANILKFAIDEGKFSGKLPTEGYKRLKYVAPNRIRIGRGSPFGGMAENRRHLAHNGFLLAALWQVKGHLSLRPRLCQRRRIPPSPGGT
jgi:hypothetical protein